MALLAAPAGAHHSFAAQYDASKLITLRGEVVRVEWTNPHAVLVLRIEDSAGKTALWEFELGSPNGLLREGFRPNTLRPGERIAIQAFPAKDGTHLGNAFRIDRADGTPVLQGRADRYPTSR